MSEYSNKELTKLVQDGIETINFIQQNKEDIQKTYGRSAIEKPTTKERTKAWEAVSAGKAAEGGGRAGALGDRETGKEGTSQTSAGSTGSDGGITTKTPGSGSTHSRDPNNKVGNVENSAGVSGTYGGDPGSKYNTESTDGLPRPGGAAKSGKRNPAVAIDPKDYDQIVSLDEETEKIESNPDYATTVTIRDATPVDFGTILEEDTSKTHKRLRGITMAALESIPETSDAPMIKKGHRREYCIDNFNGRIFVREWCNPLCAKVTAAPAQYECTCGECPRTCVNCIDDRVYSPRFSGYTD
uniref:Non-structural protein V n=1 Tax=Gainesville rodent jeilong virus 1 TaxID=3163281 RepID=A0AAU7T287_9MONO